MPIALMCLSQRYDNKVPELGSCLLDSHQNMGHLVNFDEKSSFLIFFGMVWAMCHAFFVVDEKKVSSRGVCKVVLQSWRFCV